MGGWLKEARPDNWSSHSPGPWQWALSHKTPVKPGGQWHRWWWWHVPPFWQRSIALSHTRAAETKQKGREDRKGWLIDHSVNINRQVHRAQAASSCPVCIDLSLTSTADTLGRVKPRTFVEECTEETDNQDTYCMNTIMQPTACENPSTNDC